MLDEVGIYDLYQVAVDPVDRSRLSTSPSSISPVEPNAPSDNPETGDTVVFETDDGTSQTMIFDPSEESLDDTKVFRAAGEENTDTGNPNSEGSSNPEDAARSPTCDQGDTADETGSNGGYCPQCGASIDADDRYCSQCGVQVGR